MTAAAGVLTGLAKLKRQDSARSQHRPFPPASPGLGNPAPRLHPVILAIGIGMATLGYWPHSETMPSARSVTGGSSHTAAAGGAKTSFTGEGDGAHVPVTDGEMANSNTSHNVQGTPTKQTGGALARFLEQHRHSERMKMLGPFTMGIGIFIFICANAILHENRDRETKIIHMRDMYSTVIDIHRLRQKEQKQQHHRNSTYGREAGDLRTFGAASGSLLAFSRAGGSAGGGSTEEEVLLGDEEFHRHRDQAKLDCSFASLLAPLYKDHGLGGPGLGLTHSDSIRHQWSVDGDGEKGGHHARSIVSSSISAFTLPVIKLNNCVIDEPEMEVITEEDRGGDRRDGERSQPQSSMESLAVPVASVAKASKPPGLHR
ncbi:hypothetical protein INR49_027128, partial [Caranx melampygus]